MKPDGIDSFFSGDLCLVVDPSPGFLTFVKSSLAGFEGFKAEVVISKRYAEAKSIIENRRPRILIVEHDIDGEKGLGLIEMQQKHYDESLRYSVMISQNSQDSVIAEAAEEQVDLFLLKPFSSEVFRAKMLSLIDRKANPTPYVLSINEGRESLKTADFEVALEKFARAKQLKEAPTLAYYYCGEVFRHLKRYDEALKEYRFARSFNSLHYKSLVAEFDVLVESKVYQEANNLIPILIKNFPLTSKRLRQVFIAAVFSKQFEYLHEYYSQLVRMDQRTPELNDIAIAALITGGKWNLARNNLAEAVDLFEKASIVAGRDLKVLAKIIEELLKNKNGEEAQLFFKKVKPSDMGTPLYDQVAFRIDQVTLEPSQMIERSKKMAFSGHATEENFHSIVALLASFGKGPLAETVIEKAAAQFPDIRGKLYKVLEERLEKKEGR